MQQVCMWKLLKEGPRQVNFLSDRDTPTTKELARSGRLRNAWLCIQFLSYSNYF
jgi:hypothetical protein